MNSDFFSIPNFWLVIQTLSGLFICELWYLARLLSHDTIPANLEDHDSPPKLQPEHEADPFNRGLARTRNSLIPKLRKLFSQGPGEKSSKMFEHIHEVLFRADVGVQTTDKIVNHIKKLSTSAEDLTWDTAHAALRECSADLVRVEAKEIIFPKGSPLVILIVGVNGVGKTTTIGKLAASFRRQGKSVLIAAGDTYRAAATDQLKVWAERAEATLVSQNPGADPAAVCFDAVEAAKARNVDVVIADTAGRLQSKQNLMDELKKIGKAMTKSIAEAPHHTWLVLDATTGQNAFSQVRAFKDVVPLDGLIVTKLDGTAKGGVVIGVLDEFKIPIRFVGLGEKANDLRRFEPTKFVDSLFEIDSDKS